MGGRRRTFLLLYLNNNDIFVSKSLKNTWHNERKLTGNYDVPAGSLFEYPKKGKLLNTLLLEFE